MNPVELNFHEMTCLRISGVIFKCISQAFDAHEEKKACSDGNIWVGLVQQNEAMTDVMNMVSDIALCFAGFVVQKCEDLFGFLAQGLWLTEHGGVP